MIIMRQTHSLYTRQRIHKLPLHTELINLTGLAFHGKLYGGMLSKEGLFGGTAFPTKVTLGSFLPSVSYVVKLPNSICVKIGMLDPIIIS